MLFMGKCSKEDFVKSKRRFYVVGAIMLALGFVSLSMPLLASFAVETMIGCLLLAVGLGSAFGASRGSRPSWRSYPSRRASYSSRIRSRAS